MTDPISDFLTHLRNASKAGLAQCVSPHSKLKESLAHILKNEGYVRDADGPLLPGMINFPLYGSLGDAFARSRPTAELAHRIRATMSVHSDPHRMPTFLDNHDVERFLEISVRFAREPNDDVGR